MLDGHAHHEAFAQGSANESDPALLSRLRDTARLIERMLNDDHRQRYFEALRLKRSGAQSGNVTALFFADGPSALQPEA